MKLPKHNHGLSISHNEHKTFHDDLDEYIYGRMYDWKNDEARLRAIETDELWTLSWYPRSISTFYLVAAPTLDEVIELALEVERKYEAEGKRINK